MPDKVNGDQGPLAFFESSMRVVIDATTQSDIGVYTYHMEVGLANYNQYGLVQIGKFPFKVFVANSCDNTQLIMDDVPNVIVTVNQSEVEVIALPDPIVAISYFRKSLVTDLSSADYLADLCGPVEVTGVLLADGRELPSFMTFNEGG